jgi:hypothetical protein
VYSYARINADRYLCICGIVARCARYDGLASLSGKQGWFDGGCDSNIWSLAPLDIGLLVRVTASSGFKLGQDILQTVVVLEQL